MTALGTALAFAGKGLSVLPLWWPAEKNGKFVCACGKADCRSPGKHPIAQIDPPNGPKIAPNGVRSETDETGTIKTWWRLIPRANLGVSAHGLLVLDIDVRHDGLESLNRLESEYGAMPPTWTVQTGSGGLHIYFRRPADLELNLPIIAENILRNGGEPPFGPGIDVPAYVLAPPSLHPCGRPYEWDSHPADVPLAGPPQWVIDRLAKQTRSEREKRVQSRDWGNVVGGLITEYRDAEAASVAGKLLRARSLPPEMARTLLHAWNVTFCRPPLSDFELRQIFNRIADREARRLDQQGTVR
ncbi:bifunctional DNA primase/polymerase [Sinorhizobium meliloti]|uniref:bifunctional DNA primase/polymerase n=1 Tax=Rhizobium meliloti TaxID=382 RepID=UPI0018659C4B|nr:bifunctional DNA primase/polymerase [Sinorhizobium meliloti]